MAIWHAQPVRCAMVDGRVCRPAAPKRQGKAEFTLPYLHTQNPHQFRHLSARRGRQSASALLNHNLIQPYLALPYPNRTGTGCRNTPIGRTSNHALSHEGLARCCCCLPLVDQHLRVGASPCLSPTSTVHVLHDPSVSLHASPYMRPTPGIHTLT
ncbi:hypothetical protein K431DRAFT_89888 [Polychaeton citri CBS 116435]|uniref:Uncharacterized protein n=1 Tax=Polychaeton citri CBS 116435 TaxID=1314669 RepID=A0A9P4Q6A1_9PEZI|nr:hypothetical protein K431DRAFT_89888 [Polychaeton citri CBS 116435]